MATTLVSSNVGPNPTYHVPESTSVYRVCGTLLRARRRPATPQNVAAYPVRRQHAAARHGASSGSAEKHNAPVGSRGSWHITPPSLYRRSIRMMRAGPRVDYSGNPWVSRRILTTWSGCLARVCSIRPIRQPVNSHETRTAEHRSQEMVTSRATVPNHVE